MNAPATPVAVTEAAPVDLEERILKAMHQATSKQPARADAIVAKVGGNPAAAWDAIARLIAQCRVYHCLITRAGQPQYQAIWPTGIAPRAAAWTNASHVALYGNSHTPPRLPMAADPLRDPRPDLGYATPAQKAAHAAAEKRKAAPKHPPKANKPPKPTPEAKITMNREKAAQRREHAARMIQGRTLENAIPLEDIARALGLSQEGARYAVIDLEAAGTARRVTVGRGTQRHAVVFDPRVDPSSAAQLEDGTHVMRQRGELPAQILRVIAGVSRSEAVSTAALMKRIETEGEVLYQSSVNKTLLKLAQEQRIGRTTLQRQPDKLGPAMVSAWYDITTDKAPAQPTEEGKADAGTEGAEAAPEETPAAPAVEAMPAAKAVLQYHPDDVAFSSAARQAARPGVELTSAETFVIFEPDNAPDARFHFALFCSGELGVTVADRYLLLPPSAVRRLAALLGVAQGGAAA